MSANDKTKYRSLNQLESNLVRNYRKLEKITSIFEPSNDRDVVQKVYLDLKDMPARGSFNVYKRKIRRNKLKSEKVSSGATPVFSVSLGTHRSPIAYPKAL